MTVCRYVFVIIVCSILAHKTNGWFVTAMRNIGKAIVKGVEEVGLTIKKETCKVIYGVGCPWLVDTVGGAVESALSGTRKSFAKLGMALGNKECHVRKQNCKRSVLSMEMILPFSDEFSDYDTNGDKFITYKEFVSAVMKSVHLANPEELAEPFMFADIDGDKRLGTDEFKGAPFLFAHPDNNQGRAVITSY